jgi:hypothetical protein
MAAPIGRHQRDEEADREVARDERRGDAERDVAGGVDAEVGEVRGAHDAGADERRERQQEREAGRGLAGHAGRHARHDRRAGPGDAGEQREHLRGADEQGFPHPHLRQRLAVGVVGILSDREGRRVARG